MKSDIVIIGGGIIGSAAAYFLAVTGLAGTVTVIEPDPSYARASTPAGAGGVRRLMSRPENIRMSQFSLDFFANFKDGMSTAEHSADISFRRQGYLFLTNTLGTGALMQNYETQCAEGVPAQLLDREALHARFPSVGTGDVALACHSPQDGWIDPHAALIGFRRKAEALGVTYLRDRVSALETSRSAVTHAVLDGGGRIAAHIFRPLIS